LLPAEEANMTPSFTQSALKKGYFRGFGRLQHNGDSPPPSALAAHLPKDVCRHRMTITLRRRPGYLRSCAKLRL
jgi:hypothetical protein